MATRGGTVRVFSPQVPPNNPTPSLGLPSLPSSLHVEHERPICEFNQWRLIFGRRPVSLRDPRPSGPACTADVPRHEVVIRSLNCPEPPTKPSTSTWNRTPFPLVRGGGRVSPQLRPRRALRGQSPRSRRWAASPFARGRDRLHPAPGVVSALSLDGPDEHQAHFLKSHLPFRPWRYAVSAGRLDSKRQKWPLESLSRKGILGRVVSSSEALLAKWTPGPVEWPGPLSLPAPAVCVSSHMQRSHVPRERPAFNSTSVLSNSQLNKRFHV